MELRRFTLMFCLAAQTLSRPTSEPTTYYDSSEPVSSIVGVIENAKKGGDVAHRLTRNARKCSSCVWKKSNGIVKVPYTLAPQHYTPSAAALIQDALKEFESMTCVKFVKWSTETDYLYIQSGVGCWSYIGRIIGKQVVTLSNTTCMMYGVIQHEAMHNLGFFHEHTRVDRDDYIDILWQNIAKGYAGTFDIDEGNTLNLPYDYESVMHYPTNSYSAKPYLATIVPKPDPNVQIGQRSGLSSLDVMKINAHYACNMCRAKLVHSSGTLSGNSSSANLNGGNCLWLIQVPDNKVLLEFTYVHISSTDYVKVYDGYTTSSPVLLDKTFGNGPILPLMSSERNMLVELVSSSHSDVSKFIAMYSTVSEE